MIPREGLKKVEHPLLGAEISELPSLDAGTCLGSREGVLRDIEGGVNGEIRMREGGR